MPNETKEVQLPAGTIRYREDGEGPPIVFVHGYLVDGRLWDGVVDSLSDRFRCLAPDWPMGSQSIALDRDADLSPYGVAAIIASFLERLDLDDVTIVGNDSGGAISQVLVTRHPERIGRLVLTNCDTHDNFPPGVFKALPAMAKLPGGMTIASLPFRIGAVARLTYRPFTVRPLPPELIASWLRPSMRNADIRRDLQKVTAGMNKRYTEEAAQLLGKSGKPLLLAWAPGDRFFPIRYAHRLASEVPGATVTEIADGATFLPLDQPGRVADAISSFAAA